MRSSTRHQLKQDQFSAAAQETVSWAMEHRNVITYVAIAIAVAGIIIIGGWLYVQQQDQAAGIALGHALQTYRAPLTSSGAPVPPGTKAFASAQERAKAARAEFAQVAQKYSHTHSAELARYFMGLADEDAGNTAAAEQELKNVADSAGADVAALAKFALASLYRNTGKDAQAVPLFKNLIDHPTTTVPKAQAQLALAATYEGKQPQDARNIYQQVAKENPDSPAAQVASARLSELK